ncbi:hypothetical protein QBC39DRAFT_79144 [Podospora conica]|nr:hypothetical protein QBC39DRAFT_79144 [Schizothecium conicum]
MGSVDVSKRYFWNPRGVALSVLVPDVGAPLLLSIYGLPSTPAPTHVSTASPAEAARLQPACCCCPPPCMSIRNAGRSSEYTEEGSSAAIRERGRNPLVFDLSGFDTDQPSVLTQTGHDINCESRRATCFRVGRLTTARAATCNGRNGNVVGCRSSRDDKVFQSPDQVHPTSDRLGAHHLIGPPVLSTPHRSAKTVQSPHSITQAVSCASRKVYRSACLISCLDTDHIQLAHGCPRETRHRDVTTSPQLATNHPARARHLQSLAVTPNLRAG